MIREDSALKFVSPAGEARLGAVWLDGERLDGVFAEVENGALEAVAPMGEGALTVPQDKTLREQMLRKWSEAYKASSKARRGAGASLMLLSLAACHGDGVAVVVGASNEITLTSDDATIDLTAATSGAVVTIKPTASTDPAGDNQYTGAVINGSGASGILVLNFEDATDVVVLDPTSDISGFNVIVVQNGTVDFSALGLGVLNNGILRVGSAAVFDLEQFEKIQGVELREGATHGRVTVIAASVEEVETIFGMRSKVAEGVDLTIRLPQTIDLAEVQQLLNSGVSLDLMGFTSSTVTNTQNIESTVNDPVTVADIQKLVAAGLPLSSITYSLNDSVANLASADPALLAAAQMVVGSVAFFEELETAGVNLDDINVGLQDTVENLANNPAILAQATAIVVTMAELEALQALVGDLANVTYQIVDSVENLTELQRQIEQVRGDQERALVGIDQAKAGLKELETEIENTKSRYVLRAMDELNAVVAEQSELRQALPQLEQRVSRTVIRAPMDGIVSQLNYRTPGGFVKTGDAVLEMVPTGEALVVEARIQPQDISQIRVGDAVRIRLSAYDSARYGSLDGRVSRISADAVMNQQNGSVSHFLVEVAVEGELVIENGEVVTLLPGMTATVDVLSGKRTVLEYFWQPIARVQELALRD